MCLVLPSAMNCYIYLYIYIYILIYLYNIFYNIQYHEMITSQYDKVVAE